VLSEKKILNEKKPITPLQVKWAVPNNCLCQLIQAYHQYGVGSHPALWITKKGALNSQPQVYQLLAHGRWFSPGTPASSTTKTGRHDIAEILLKVALNTKIQIQIQVHVHVAG
jgi:hypothetical protein